MIDNYPDAVLLKRAKTEVDKDLRKKEILKAAKIIFAARGYHETRISEIAEACNLSYGAVYWYFKTKAQLFHELISLEEQELKAAIAAARKQALDSGRQNEAFKISIKAVLDFFEADKEGIKLLFREPFRINREFGEHLLEIFEGFTKDIENLLIDAKRKGLVVDYPSRIVAFAIGAMISQIANRRIDTDDGLTTEQVAKTLESLILKGLLPR